MARKSPSQKRNVTTMRLDKKLLDTLGAIATAEGRSRNNYVEHILRRAVRSVGKKAKHNAPVFG